MEHRNGELHAETDEARAGSTPNIVRWVLLIGLALAIVAMSATWIIGAATFERPVYTKTSRPETQQDAASQPAAAPVAEAGDAGTAGN